MDQIDTAQKILDIAERRMREAGYNAVSYRDVAKEMGIKSASLHYHFPRKEDLGIALVRQYSEKFWKLLENRTLTVDDPVESLAAYVDLYRHALLEQNLICLCAVLGAEAPGLPTAVTAEIKNFFNSNIAWLEKEFRSIGHRAPSAAAKNCLALLEGAMVVSSVNEDLSIFEAAATHVQTMMVDALSQ